MMAFAPMPGDGRGAAASPRITIVAPPYDTPRLVGRVPAGLEPGSVAILPVNPSSQARPRVVALVRSLRREDPCLLIADRARGYASTTMPLITLLAEEGVRIWFEEEVSATVLRSAVERRGVRRADLRAWLNSRLRPRGISERWRRRSGGGLRGRGRSPTDAFRDAFSVSWPSRRSLTILRTSLGTSTALEGLFRETGLPYPCHRSLGLDSSILRRIAAPPRSSSVRHHRHHRDRTERWSRSVERSRSLGSRRGLPLGERQRHIASRLWGSASCPQLGAAGSSLCAGCSGSGGDAV